MSSPSFKVTAFVYGYDQVRLEADLLVPIKPPSLAQNMKELHSFAQIETQKFMLDLKHSNPMTCEFCGKPARENNVSVGSWLHLPPKGTVWMGKPSPGPSITLYVHAVCDMAGPCGKQAQAVAKQTADAMGAASPPPQTFPSGTVYPMNGACAFCKTDGSAKGQLLKCGGCKTTHYCGKECQQVEHHLPDALPSS